MHDAERRERARGQRARRRLPNRPGHADDDDVRGEPVADVRREPLQRGRGVARRLDVSLAPRTRRRTRGYDADALGVLQLVVHELFVRVARLAHEREEPLPAGDVARVRRHAPGGGVAH
eukprot:29282-Pelagococcus_subviridis.AAC.9